MNAEFMFWGPTVIPVFVLGVLGAYLVPPHARAPYSNANGWGLICLALAVGWFFGNMHGVAWCVTHTPR